LKCDPYIFQKTEAYHRFAQNWGHLFDNQMKLVFKQDKNFNLAQRAVKEATLYSVYHVVRIFNTIYLSELCRMCDKDEETITQILSELTNRGFINAEIDKKKIIHISPLVLDKKYDDSEDFLRFVSQKLEYIKDAKKAFYESCKYVVDEDDERPKKNRIH